jgi:hypothetical protein
MKPIYFKIPFNGVNVLKSKFTIPEYTLPAKDWIKHNQIDLKNQNIQIFTFIRNPLERVILQYKHQLKHRPALRQYPMPFKEWCLASFQTHNIDKFMQNNPKEFLPQKRWIEGFDNFNLKMVKICDNISHKNIEFKKTDVERYYDNASKEVIHSWFGEDFRLIDDL